MHTEYGEIGVCSKCYQKLSTTKDQNFDCGDDIKAVFSPFFYEKSVKDAVKKYKFSNQRLYGNLFGKMIYEKLKEIQYIWDFDAIIPVPLHELRLLERGYNQSEIIADEISKLSGVVMINDGLFRIRETKRQSSLKGIARRENVKGAFYAYPNVIDGKRIILVDDICTMGETLRASAEALKNAGAKEIIAITLCVSTKEEKKFYLY
ncbi:MAG: ComF family protein [Clostridia bacterium]|nr:ComF family protein [Clostridia bacterium]